MNTELATRQNGIAKAEKAMAPNLTEREVKVINASRSPHCSRLIRQGDPSVNKILINALRGLHTIAGYSKPEKSDPETVAEIVVAMTDVIKRHTWLRVRELDRVINQGLIGEYGDFYGLNARVLNGWIKTYFEAGPAGRSRKSQGGGKSKVLHQTAAGALHKPLPPAAGKDRSALLAPGTGHHRYWQQLVRTLLESRITAGRCRNI
jgi:hypothetical protein